MRAPALRALSALSVAVIFVAATGLSVAVHANLPLARSLAGRAVTRAVSGVLGGTVEVSAFSHVGLTQLSLPRVALFDTYGHRVLVLSDVRLDISARVLLRDLLQHGRRLSFVADHLRVERSELSLVPDPSTGEPTIVRALAPRPSTTAAGTAPAEQRAPSGTRVFLPSVELGVVTAHATLPGLPALEARLRSVRGRILGSPEGVAVDVERFGAVLHGMAAEARGTGTLAVRAPGPLRASFEGFFGDVELMTSIFLDGSRLEFVADLPSASPEAVSRLFPGWPLRETGAAHLDLRGDLPDLRARATLRAGAATLDAEGAVTLGDRPHATFDVKGRHLNAQLVSEGAPATDLAVDATITPHMEAGVPAAEAHAHSGSTTISGQSVPAADLDVKIRDRAAEGSLLLHEPGLPISASFHVSPSGVVDAEAHAAGVEVAHVTRLPRSDLRGVARARAVVHIEGSSVRGSLDADVSGLVVRGARIARAHVALEAAGPLGAPAELRGNVHVEAQHLSVAGIDVDRATVDARGRGAATDFDARLSQVGGPTLRAAGTLRLSPRPALQNTRVSIRRDPVVIEGEVAALDLKEESVDIRNVHVSGAGGSVTGSLRVARGVVEAEAEGQNVDLDAVGRALGVPRGTIAGNLRISASIAAGRDVTRGRVRIGLGDATIASVGGLALQLSADLDGRAVSGGASGLVAGVGTFGTTWKGELGGQPFDVASWLRATGSAEVQVGDVRLALLSPLLPKGGPIGRVGGRAYARVSLDRKTITTPLPSATVSFATQGLVVDLEGEPGTKPTRIDGIDLNATGAFDGATGDSTGTTIAADPHGDLVAASGTARIDLPRLLREPTRALSQLVETPLDAVFVLPRRSLADLPAMIPVGDLVGAVNSTVTVRGTLAHPTLFATIDGTQVAMGGAVMGRPVDLHADAQYAWSTHALAARATASLMGRAVATARVQGTLPEGPSSFVGGAKLSLDGLPFDLLSVVAKNGMSGALFGAASWLRDSGGGSLGADLRIADTAVAHTALGEGRLRLETHGRTMSAKLGFAGAHGSLDATADAELSWSALVPTLARTAPIRAHVTAHDFSAVALSPLVTGVLTRLGGHLDADASLELRPEPDPGVGWVGGIQGKAALRDGTVLIDALGLEVRDLACSAEAHGSGVKTNIAIRDVRGRVRSTKDNLRGQADLVLDGMRLVSGSGTLRAADMPILFRGAPQGRITGRAEARLERQKDRMLVDLDIPALATLLPQASARAVIDIAENPDITVLQQVETGPKVSPGLPWRLAVHLGDEVTLRRRDVNLTVKGSPVIDLGEETEVTGSVDITPGGRVPVLGKGFVIDHGRVIFDTGEPANPRVDVSASWRAPNETMVYVEVTGTLREAKIALRSDPPLPEPQVFALLLGGSSSEQSSSSESDSGGAGAAGAMALGSGVAALGVNQLLSDNPVEIRVETTSEKLPRYTAAVRIRPNLWFEASEYQQSQSGVGGQNDRNVVSGTIDYRFTRRWSLRTEAGTAGGAMDLLWQYRY
jgi:autotransporter translocation and assembly factor TamB